MMRRQFQISVLMLGVVLGFSSMVVHAQQTVNSVEQTEQQHLREWITRINASQEPPALKQSMIAVFQEALVTVSPSIQADEQRLHAEQRARAEQWALRLNTENAFNDENKPAIVGLMRTLPIRSMDLRQVSIQKAKIAPSFWEEVMMARDPIPPQKIPVEHNHKKVGIKVDPFLFVFRVRPADVNVVRDNLVSKKDWVAKKTEKGDYVIVRKVDGKPVAILTSK